MSKAEDLSRRYVLPFLDKQYEKYGEHKQMELSRFDGYDMMSAYEEGYYQAEKDLELTWEDVKEICDIAFEEACKFQRNMKGSLIYKEQHYTEILKRFNKERKEK